MHIIKLLPVAAAVALAACSGENGPFNVTGPAAPAISDRANVLLSGNRLGVVDLNAPGKSFDNLGQIALPAGDTHTLVSIDRRPQNGYLYALGYDAAAPSLRLYVVAPETLTATAVGNAIVIAGLGNGDAATRFEIDFNPAVDRVRVQNSLGQNYRLNPNNGALVQADGSTNVAGTVTPVHGTAYTNSAPNLGITTQYTVTEGANSSLFLQNPPNAGTLTNGVAINATADRIVGFDIAPSVLAAAGNTAVTSGNGILLTQNNNRTSISSLDLVTGKRTALGSINDAASTVGFALQAPSAAALVALSSDGSQLLRFSASAPSVTTAATITGVTAGESLVGIDFRPATGGLYALGVNATADTATIYLLDPQTGAASVVGTASSVTVAGVDMPDPATAGYGVDFNPKVDRIRVTTSTGLNLRLNPITGTAVAQDGGINGAVTGASAAAYTNSVGGTTATTLYVLDNTTGRLTIQSPPNDGTQISPLGLTLNGQALAFTAASGFDIPSDVRVATDNAAVTSGFGFAALTVGGSTGLYRIDLTNGNSTLVGTIGSGAGVRGLASGQTHAR